MEIEMKKLRDIIIKYIIHDLTHEQNDEVSFTYQAILSKIIISNSNLVGKELEQLKKQKFITTYKKIENKKNEIEWTIVLNLKKIFDLYSLTNKNKIIDTKKNLEIFSIRNALTEIDKKRKHKSIEYTAKKEFDDGSYIRWRCASCGQFIKEIRSWQQLKEITEGNHAKCKNGHWNNIEVKTDKIQFSGEPIKIISVFVK